MSSEYIKRSLAKAEFTGNFQESYPTAQIHALLDTIPAATVREVVRGKWEWGVDGETGHNIRRCSCCSSGSGWAFNFCPNCGADMR